MNRMNERKRKNKTTMQQRRPGWHWKHRKERERCFDNGRDRDSYNSTTTIGEGDDGEATKIDTINNY